jgi:predicted nuclease of predicted toxin-antitoxin system
VRLLIDECLSPALVREAQRSGSEAHHLAHLGKAGLEDREVVAFALARDMILVTNNASHFRRLYAAQELHPGLMILVPNTDRETQLRLLQAALVRLRAMRDLVNKALEMDFDGDSIIFDEYELSRGGEAR